MTEFVTKLISRNKHRLCYLSALAADNREAWYFILLHPSKYDAFYKIDPEQGYDITDYGEVLESGFGKQAPVEVVSQINKKYDCDF